MIDHFSQAYSEMPEIMVRLDQDEERRKAQRFPLRWEVAVKRTHQAGGPFDRLGTAQNLSSLGALLYVPEHVGIGEKLEVHIKIPFKRNNWMKYAAEVVHLTAANPGGGIGVRFETAVPVFVAR